MKLWRRILRVHRQLWQLLQIQVHVLLLCDLMQLKSVQCTPPMLQSTRPE